MEIGGSDIFFENVCDEATVLGVVRKYWPNMVWEIDKDEYGVHIFMHPSKEAAENWDKVGLTDNNDTDLIYAILTEKNTTFVIDCDKKNQYIIDEIGRLITDEDYWWHYLAGKARQQWMKENA